MIKIYSVHVAAMLLVVLARQGQ